MDNNRFDEIIKSVTRVEVIEEGNVEDGKGRVYVNFNEDNDVQLFLQDEGRTLKIFISKKNKG